MKDIKIYFLTDPPEWKQIYADYSKSDLHVVNDALDLLETCKTIDINQIVLLDAVRLVVKRNPGKYNVTVLCKGTRYTIDQNGKIPDFNIESPYEEILKELKE